MYIEGPKALKELALETDFLRNKLAYPMDLLHYKNLNEIVDPASCIPLARQQESARYRKVAHVWQNVYRHLSIITFEEYFQTRRKKICMPSRGFLLRF